MSNRLVHVVGGGLAGCEAAWQLLNQGFHVRLYEMRPQKTTAAHHTGDLAELVCSNSLKSMSPQSAPGQLKQEMQALNSLILSAGMTAQVPAGQALAVDRKIFSDTIRDKLASFTNFTRVDAEITDLPDAAAATEPWIIATGPLTSQGLAETLQKICGTDQRLFFYDAIAPVIDGDSIDYNFAFRSNRYGDEKEIVEEGDYVNLPLNKDEYEAFIDAVIAAEKMPLHGFENTKYFEACLPIEVMIERGRETLRFGPMKPVGLTDPRTGRWPWAAVQLRMENSSGSMYSMVGFQTKMKWPEQQRVFKMIPGLGQAEFFRLGSVHRNTYLKSPDVLQENFSFKNAPHVFLAGQISGVEGYTESSAMGLLVGRAVAAHCRGETFVPPPANTMIGALANYVTKGCRGEFQPMNANLGLLPTIPKKRGQSKAERKQQQCSEAQAAFTNYLQREPSPQNLEV